MGILDKLFIQFADKRHIRNLLIEDKVQSGSSYSDAKSLVKQMSRFQLFSTPIASVFLIVKKYIGYQDLYGEDNLIFPIMDDERRKIGFNVPESATYSDIYDYTYTNILEGIPPELTPDIELKSVVRVWTNTSAIAIFSFYRHLRKHAVLFD